MTGLFNVPAGRSRRRLVMASGLAVVALAVACGGSPSRPTTVTPPVGGTAAPAPTPPPTPTSPPPAPSPPPPQLKVTKFMMFGDSLTDGYVASSARQLVSARADSYPSQLYEMLTARYTGQQFDVWNEGRQGEWAIQGQLRFAAATRSHRPEVIIIMEGANDLGARGERAIQPTLEGLDNMLRDGRALGATVMLASLPPERPPLGNDRRLIDQLNAGIKRLAERQRVMFVDVNAEFGNDGSLLSQDGLHPSAAGYRKIAEIFFDTIRRTFEVAPTT